jgi:hypothetical protein
MPTGDVKKVPSGLGNRLATPDEFAAPVADFTS